MKNRITTYLESYSYDPIKINRLIVSNFLFSNKVEYVENQLIYSLLIKKGNEDWGDFLMFLKLYRIKSVEELIQAFEYVISPEDRVVTGAIYTPKLIREFIIDKVFNDLKEIESIKVCDPACGCSGFLLSAALKIHEETGKKLSSIIEENLFGLDIQGYSVERSKILLSLLAIINGEDKKDYSFNFFKGNALEFDWFEQIHGFSGFDAIVGNPPYVCSRNIEEESKVLLEKWSVCSTGHPDLYIPFFELGLKYLKGDGMLGYITMNTFFKSINGRALREYLSQFENSIIDFGGHQVFESKSTYTCICTIRKRSADHIAYAKLDSVNNLESDVVFKKINLDVLDHLNGWNLQDIELLNRIESVGTPLGEKFRTRNGIATLKNKIYIFNPIDEDKNFYYLGKDQVYKIEKEICTDIINPNKFTKAQSVDEIRQKVIFPYRYSKTGIEIIDEGELKSKFPFAYEYLKDKKKLLATRDKGKGKYEKWYAFGRNQSLDKMKYKLFFPHISSDIPNFIINDNEHLLFYNGLALIGKNRRELKLMQKLMGSRLFWFYVTKSSKPYGSGYYSLSRNYIKKFGIYDFSEDEIQLILNEHDQNKIDEFIETKYNIELS
ncbi:MAG: N-6 DNA methylase [Allomuricauda sp.]